MHTLKITIDPIEGAIIRVLGLIERKGFTLSKVLMHQDLIAVEVALTNNNITLDKLCSQLQRLVIVKDVNKHS